MARSPAIRGRPTPGRKSRSSASSSLGAVSSPAAGAGTSGASSLLPIRTPIPKALKRAQKRAQLLSKASQSGQGVDGRPLATSSSDWTQISKSALRRRKRKARDELAKDESQGRQGGIKDLTEAMEEVEEEILEEEEESRAARTKSNPNPITAKQRQRVLEQESQRQKAILADPSFQASPFAALRQHLSHSMAR